MASQPMTPVAGFVALLYGRREGKKRLRRAGEKALARHGIRVRFDDEPEGDNRTPSVVREGA